MTEEINAYDPEKRKQPIYSDRDPLVSDSIEYEMFFQESPFWVNKGPPRSVWAWWEGRYRLLDLET